MSVELEELEPDSGTDSSSSLGYVERVLAGPGVSLVLMALVSLLTWTAFQAGNVTLFTASSITGAWWQFPVSIFAHANTAHLVGNATVVAAAGSLVVLTASVIRYHLFFILSGSVAALSQVAATAALGSTAPVLGASGAALALVGYILTSNAVSSWVLAQVSRTAVVVIVVGVALLVTFRYAGLDVANVAHLAGVLCGLVTGHFNLLKTR